MNTKIVQVEGIDVTLKKSARTKHLRISVSDKGVSVSIPEKMPYTTAETFIKAKAAWIKQSVQKVQQQTQHTVFTHETDFSTKFRKLKLIADNRNNMRLLIHDDCFEIFYPHHIDLENEQVQQVIRKQIEHVWKLEAQEFLPKRITELADRFNFNFKSLTIKNTRSFWGKCMGDNSITLSLHLMHLPNHLIDYVILHELCHTIHKNHQKEFWQLLDKVTKNQAKSLAKEMKNYSTRFF